MIVAGAQRLRTLYRRVEDQKQAADRIRGIEQTRDALVTLEPALDAAVSAYSLVQDRLPDDQRADIRSRFARLADLLRTSQRDFSSTWRQVAKLENSLRSVEATQAEIDKTWSRNIDAQVHPFRELLVIVSQIPDLKDDVVDFRSALNDLTSLSREAPRTHAQLARFDASLERVRAKAQTFDGVPESVRSFLGRVAGDLATLDDVTPEVLGWLDRHGALDSFSVRLGGMPS